MPPWQGGGNMIKDVTFERPHTIPRQRVSRPGPAHRRCGRAGAALDWLDNLGHERAAAYEHELLNYATAELSKIPGLTSLALRPARLA